MLREIEIKKSDFEKLSDGSSLFDLIVESASKKGLVANKNHADQINTALVNIDVLDVDIQD